MQIFIESVLLNQKASHHRKSLCVHNLSRGRIFILTIEDEAYAPYYFHL